MSILYGASRNNGSDAILSAVRISKVYQNLTGVEPRLIGKDRWRGPATWRGGNGPSVSGDDSMGLWHDFVSSRGGGILDLVTEVRGGTRQDALRWVADIAGVPLQDAPLSAEDRARLERERREVEQDLPSARLWQRAAIALGEELLAQLKASFFDAPAESNVKVSDLRILTNELERWQRLEGLALAEEYRAWRDRTPELVAGMVHAARMRDRAETRAILCYLTETTP